MVLQVVLQLLCHLRRSFLLLLKVQLSLGHSIGIYQQLTKTYQG